ncbi:unnamed protein product [Brachionus calyciflorus]|uniref:Uncharacterized protein n=1 Tax=Brachionus calyciflorus TaxID=104777 RepID=A0A814H968_9BILA|nr:unnamed protein product [Brachionus calyciflorus]
MQGCSRVDLKSNLDEFIWRQNNTINRIDSYEQILNEIGRFYPVNVTFELEKLTETFDEVSLLSLNEKDACNMNDMDVESEVESDEGSDDVVTGEVLGCDESDQK